MIPALTMMCALGHGACQYARGIADAIDAATADDRLRATLVVYAWEESRFGTLAPSSWDARADIAHGPWQLWGPAGHLDLRTQARAWLWRLQRGGAHNLCGFGRAAKRIAWERALEAQRLLQQVTPAD
jgi:hypothetical protein